MKLSFKWATGAIAALLFVVTVGAQAQGQGQQQGQGAPAAPGRGQGQGQGGGAGRAGGGAAPGYTNLQVLPRDITQQQLGPIMQGFAAALGVTCDHCHVDGNRAADDKQPKKTARVMMLMARDANAKLTASAAELGKPAASITPVMCGTCHRGKTIPDYVAPPPPARGGGAAPAGGGGGAPAGGGGRGGRGQ